ncbi:unnamed protein product [Chrysoparadoxa australica]
MISNIVQPPLPALPSSSSTWADAASFCSISQGIGGSLPSLSYDLGALSMLGGVLDTAAVSPVMKDDLLRAACENFTSETAESIIPMLLNRGASPHSRCDVFGLTALHWCCINGYTQCIVHLLKAGASPEVPDRDGNTAIVLAAQHNRPEAVRLLMRYVLCSDRFSNEEERVKAHRSAGLALIAATRMGHTRTVQELLHGSCPLDIQGGAQQQTALMMAARYRNKRLALAFIKAGAAVNCRCSRAMTALMYDAKCGGGACAQLIAAGANCNDQDSNGWTPLMFATTCGNISAVNSLVTAGADPMLRNNEDASALDLCYLEEPSTRFGIETSNKRQQHREEMKSIISKAVRWHKRRAWLMTRARRMQQQVSHQCAAEAAAPAPDSGSDSTMSRSLCVRPTFDASTGTGSSYSAKVEMWTVDTAPEGLFRHIMSYL